MDSLQQQVLSLLSEDWKSRLEIVRQTGASEHEVQVALNGSSTESNRDQLWSCSRIEKRSNVQA